MIGLVFTISSVCSTKRFLFYAGFIKKATILASKKARLYTPRSLPVGEFFQPQERFARQRLRHREPLIDQRARFPVCFNGCYSFVTGFSVPWACAGTAPVPGANPSFSAIYVHNRNVVHVVFLGEYEKAAEVRTQMPFV